METIETIETNGVVQPKKKPRKSLRAIAAKTAPYVPSLEDPRAELRRLVFEHKVMMRKAVAIDAMISDRKSRETGEVIQCRGVAEDRKFELKGVVASMKKDAERLESSMVKELRKIPIYQVFLKNVYGVGPVVASYLVAELDPRGGKNRDGVYRDPPESIKPSKWKRFCGLAVINGRLERPARGEKNHFSSEMRTRLFQAFAAMWKNAARNGTWVEREDLGEDVDPTTLEQRDRGGKTKYKLIRKEAPNGVTSKYLTIWTDYKHRMSNSERVVDGKIVNGAGKEVSAKGMIHSTGWHKAADVLVEDLYTVWRALEGLPVWPSYYASKLGYEHMGKISVNAPKMLTVEEALEMVGNVGCVARDVPVEDADVDDVDDEEGENLITQE